ncbi:uncharacterized protein LOC131258071 isoform X2 [Magnolia sinica]|uniref:uncharacterized protein LOC131258070 isoform X2 n=1 Tax=Magnolia sinica TaxID=86752 RepID=UPI00265AE37B|nr:uncharacterized protein LOC131258070 isoform X2 [Magnolia sinica]XP_058115103.1 uncharacterized protein LOC131258071 isoform X2 [Magnolia sinica]
MEKLFSAVYIPRTIGVDATLINATVQLQKELSALQSELDRIQFLLKIADPTREAARRRDSKAQTSKSNQPDIPVSNVTKKAFSGAKEKLYASKACKWFLP